MSQPKLIFGLLDTSRQVPDRLVADRLRGLTIAWSRFKYFGSMIEADSVDVLLSEALKRNAAYCLIQAHGHILDEVWHPDGGEALDIYLALETWIRDTDFLVTGRIVGDDDKGYGLDDGFVLVDLGRYRTLGCPRFGEPGDGPRPRVRPRVIAGAGAERARLDPTGGTMSVVPAAPGWSLVEASLRAGLPVYGLPTTVAAGVVDLRPDDETELAFLRRFLANDDGPATLTGAIPGGRRGQQFLNDLQGLTANLPHGVFIWNLEGYGDVELPPEGFEPPLRSLYTVAAGFKPNRILETHGFDERTRVVVFDYSQPALAFRRLLQTRWDGTDYPDFLKAVFQEQAVANAFYVLWNGASPDTVSWPDIEARWQAELAAWGGARALRQHWRRFRDLRVDYVYCDVLANPTPLLERVRDEPASVIWWSNAFFSVHSNWFYSAADRRARYCNFIASLAERAPRLFLYGADCNNISVNFVQARPYHAWYDRAGGDELEPGKWHRHEIRF